MKNIDLETTSTFARFSKFISSAVLFDLFSDFINLIQRILSFILSRIGFLL